MNEQELTKRLTAPFEAQDVEWRIQQTTQDKSRGLAVAFITSRAIQKRLDETVGPFHWKTEFSPWHQIGKGSQLCALSIYDEERKEWVTKTDGAKNSVGEAVMNDGCSNVHIINELGIPVLAMGLKDVVICASPDGILVSDKEQSSYIKPYVDRIDQKVMFAEKSWGSYRVLDAGAESHTVKVTLKPGHGMNYHSHAGRDEVWVVISGEGRAVVDDREREVKAGDIVTMKAGSRHKVTARSQLQMIEVQMSREISVHDKKKY